jgi:4a-hydroxytetrahydrobiopterin dehydratase
MKDFILEKLKDKLSSGWKEVGGKLTKKYKFDSYGEVLDFVKEVGEVAEEQNHHPEMLVKYQEVIVTIHDHEAGGVSDKCYKFVKAVEKKLG